MSEWKTVKIGDVCEKGSSNIAQNEIADNNGEYPIYGAAGFIKNVDFYKQDKPYIGIVKDGAGVGRVSVHPAKSSLIGTMQYIFPKENIDIKFLAEFLKYQNLSRFYTGATIPHIYFKDYQNIPLKLPSLQKQKHISAVLGKCAELTVKNKRILEKYDTLIKSRFIEMFGDPVQNPMGWEVKKLGKMCSAIMNGTTPKGGEQVYVENGITFLRSQNVWRNKIDLDDVAYIDEATHKSMKKSSLKKYDILMTKTGRINTENSSLGRAALFLGEDDSANINGHVYLIRLEKEYNHEFVIRILTSPEYRDYIRSICVGGIDKRQVNKDHIEEFPIIQPPKELQDEYSTYVQQIDKSKFAVQKSLEKAETLYKSLMQQYFA